MFQERQKGDYIIIFVLYSFQRTKTCYIYTVEEKQKYHVTFFCEKNKSIILHHRSITEMSHMCHRDKRHAFHQFCL